MIINIDVYLHVFLRSGPSAGTIFETAPIDAPPIVAID